VTARPTPPTERAIPQLLGHDIPARLLRLTGQDDHQAVGLAMKLAERDVLSQQLDGGSSC
jgi:hypothetical protein